MRKKRRIPQRQCVGCGEMKNKKELIRVIKNPEEQIMIDATGKKNGRGAYICNSINCFDMARQNKGLERSLKSEIPKDVYDELIKELKAIGQ